MTGGMSRALNSVFFDRGYLRGWVRGVATIGASLACAAMLFGVIFAISNHVDHVSCLRLHENTGLPTRYERSGPTGECYIQDNGQWIPKGNWRTGGDR